MALPSNQLNVRLCECGCGQETPVHEGKTCRRARLVKGEPRRFVEGHQLVFRSNQEKERRRAITSLLPEIIRPKKHQNYDNPLCLYCGCQRSFWSGKMCGFCYKTLCLLKKTGVKIPALANANFDFDKPAFRRLTKMTAKKEQLEEQIKELTKSLVVRKFRNQQRHRLPVEQEAAYGEYDSDGYRDCIAVDSRTPLDELLDKEEEDASCLPS